MGLLSLPAAAAMLAMGLPLGRMTSRYGPKPVMVLGFALSTVGALLLTQYANPAFQLGTFHTGSPNGLAVPVLLLIAPALVLVGTVAVLISMSNVIVLSVPSRELGVQTGMNQTFRNLGSAIGPVLVSAIISSFVIGTLPLPPPVGPQPLYSVQAFQYCFVVLAVIALLGLGLTMFLKNYRFHADGTRSDVSLVGKHPVPVFPADEPVVPPVSTEGSTETRV
jgi:MFS family permease